MHALLCSAQNNYLDGLICKKNYIIIVIISPITIIFNIFCGINNSKIRKALCHILEAIFFLNPIILQVFIIFPEKLTAL